MSCERRNLTAKHFILNDELGGGGGGSPEKFSMQFTDSKSQQQSPLVAFLATTVLVIIKIIENITIKANQE